MHKEKMKKHYKYFNLLFYEKKYVWSFCIFLDVKVRKIHTTLPQFLMQHLKSMNRLLSFHIGMSFVDDNYTL
jgi:hypothetical protein